jgi:hypothetical protein
MLDTLGRGDEKAAMTTTPKRNRLAKEVLALGLATVVVSALVVSCVLPPGRTAQPTVQDQPARYIVTFGDPGPPAQLVPVANMPAFQKALKNAVWSDIQVYENGQPSSLPVPTTRGGSPTCGYMTVPATNAGGTTATTHVTQKVGVQTEKQLAKVLAAVCQDGNESSH